MESVSQGPMRTSILQSAFSPEERARSRSRCSDLDAFVEKAAARKTTPEDRRRCAAGRDRAAGKQLGLVTARRIDRALAVAKEPAHPREPVSCGYPPKRASHESLANPFGDGTEPQAASRLATAPFRRSPRRPTSSAGRPLAIMPNVLSIQSVILKPESPKTRILMRHRKSAEKPAESFSSCEGDRMPIHGCSDCTWIPLVTGGLARIQISAGRACVLGRRCAQPSATR